jgi:hypothetical protein
MVTVVNVYSQKAVQTTDATLLKENPQKNLCLVQAEGVQRIRSKKIYKLYDNVALVNICKPEETTMGWTYSKDG